MIPIVTLALVTGFLGSGHCLGMCGGLVCGLALAGGNRSGPWFHLAYNSGRITTYAVIGAVAGWAGSAVACTGGIAPAARVAVAVADIFVIAAGAMTLAGKNFGGIGMAGAEPGFFTARIARAATMASRLPGPAAAFALGLLMGFLPCPFLYAMLLTAAAGGNAASGALAMAAFGLGTLPALAGFGWLAGMIGSRARGRMLAAAGLVVMLMGAYNLYRHLKMLGWIRAATPFAPDCCL